MGFIQRTFAISCIKLSAAICGHKAPKDKQTQNINWWKSISSLINFSHLKLKIKALAFFSLQHLKAINLIKYVIYSWHVCSCIVKIMTVSYMWLFMCRLGILMQLCTENEPKISLKQYVKLNPTCKNPCSNKIFKSLRRHFKINFTLINIE